MKSHFASVAPCLAIGCIIAVLRILSGCSEPEKRDFRSQPMHNVIVFRPIIGTSQKTPSGTQVAFYFRNGSDRPVELPGYFGARPTAGVIQPAFIEYEVQVGDGWQPLDVKYDGISDNYVVEPGADLRLLVTLGPIETRGVATTTPVRVKLNSMLSDQFTLEDVAP